MGKKWKESYKDVCLTLYVSPYFVSSFYYYSNNIGQIAYLNAQQHGLKRIYFGGFFIRGHPITMNTLSYAIDFWSNGEMKALFLRHEGHLGATGAVSSSNSNRNNKLLLYHSIIGLFSKSLWKVIILINFLSLATLVP